MLFVYIYSTSLTFILSVVSTCCYKRKEDIKRSKYIPGRVVLWFPFNKQQITSLTISTFYLASIPSTFFALSFYFLLLLPPPSFHFSPPLLSFNIGQFSRIDTRHPLMAIVLAHIFLTITPVSLCCYTGCSLNIVGFFQEFSKVCHISLASTRLLLVVQRIGVTVHSHCVESVEGVLKRSWLGKGFSE